MDAFAGNLCALVHTLVRLHQFKYFNSKSNLHDTRGITSKCVTISEWRGPSLRLGTWETQKRRNGGELLATVHDLTCPGIEPKSYHADGDVFNCYANRLFKYFNFCVGAFRPTDIDLVKKDLMFCCV